MMVGAALMSGVANAQQGKLSDDTLKIGVLTDMSGLYADFPAVPAPCSRAKMAVEDFGGKMFGKTIEVVSADHQNKPDVGKGITQQWFDRDKVDATFENLGSPVALAVSGVGAEKNRITVMTGSATSRLTNEDCKAGHGDSLGVRHHFARQRDRQGRGESRWRFILLPLHG